MSQNSMHIAYMGDPTLKIRNLPAVESLKALSSNNFVYLNWNRIGNNNYAIYRFDTLNRIFSRIHDEPINDTFFVDSFNHSSGRYVYAVKCIKLETTGSGTYYNTGGAAYATVDHVNSIITVNGGNQHNLRVYPNPASDQIHILFERNSNSSNTYQAIIYDLYGKAITNFQIQPKDNREASIDISLLADGIYICEIVVDGVTYTQKIVVSK